MIKYMVNYLHFVLMFFTELNWTKLKGKMILYFSKESISTIISSFFVLFYEYIF